MTTARTWPGSRRVRMRISTVVATVVLGFGCGARPAYSWDSRTHMLIARLAVAALPSSPLAQTLATNEALLEHDAVAPDVELKRRYGHAEEIHHYIDLENFGPNPLADLNPDFTLMRQRYGDRVLERSGTLPWTIEATSAGLQNAWRTGDCAKAIQLSGYLAHYVGDASQPLHSTRYYDGYPGDKGVHSRLESAVDHEVPWVDAHARPQVHVAKIDSVWTTTIDEIRNANALIPQVIQSDRAVRASAGREWQTYDRDLMTREGTMIAGQVAAASSALSSIWLYEWSQAGRPAACVNTSVPERPNG
jgi:Zinc dependent phospholipase C